MWSSLYLFMFMTLLFCFHLITATNSSFSAQPLCHDDERSALLQFKHSFVIDKYASRNPSAYPYPKVESWKHQGGETSDCCSWDGVECDEDTGHVIGLDLTSSFLFGSINSSSSLFSLVHLQSLNLSDNHFNYSQIPCSIGHLSRLTSLNLSWSSFFGQIPSEISKLSKMTSLDLSYNVYQYPWYTESLLKLENPTLRSLVQNLTNLKELHLTQVNISSTVPHILTNMSALTGLGLGYSGLYGEFPTGIFLLPNLRVLDVQSNQNLTGYLPKFLQSSPLEVLSLAGMSFSGKLPNSIGNLNSLKWLGINRCKFSGSIPSSLGNLTQLRFLYLGSNYFTGHIPPSLANLNQLSYLSLANNSFSSDIPSSLRNLTRLNVLVLNNNQLVGEIPSWLGNLTQLTRLCLHRNKFHGSIPQSIFELTNLIVLKLSENDLSGTMEVEMFLKLKNLIILNLNFNKLSLLTTGQINATLPQFKSLELAFCNLSEFPEFLRYQDELEWLQLGGNNMHGHIPKWIWNVGEKTLLFIGLSRNFLTGFEEPRLIPPWNSLRVLDLRSNILQGSLPVPPFSTLVYRISNNSLTGEIPLLICNASFLHAIDLSKNNLSGTIPQCLSSFSDSLTTMNLGGNNFHGAIPQPYKKGTNLEIIDFSQNHLDGLVPRSLANCKKLEILNLGNNHVNDTFPFWLGTLPELKMLLLRSNQFHGTITGPMSNFDFPKLRVVDLSHNDFTGELPSKYFRIWNNMKIHNVSQSTYPAASFGLLMGYYYSYVNFTVSMTMENKGIEALYYSATQGISTTIILSGNKFEGEIPESIGNLKGLQALNLSNNALTGPIPTSLGNLTNLEVLDISQNELSGEIPQQLTQLTFLALFNVSYNHLMGPIPHANQFNTFDNSSFVGNLELCGDPFSKKCGGPEASSPPPSSTFEDKDSEFPSKTDWIVICIGYAGGLVVGLSIGHILTTRKHEWFVRTFGRRQQKWKREKKRGRRH